MPGFQILAYKQFNDWLDDLRRYDKRAAVRGCLLEE
jgi:hypothetical protein